MATILLSYKLGIDIGSRTVKITVLNGANVIVRAYGLYHEQKFYSAMHEALKVIHEKVGNMQCTVGLTGNSAPVVAHRTRLFYVNEETAVAHLVKQTVDAADVTIEMGAAATYVQELATGTRWNVDDSINRGDFIEVLAAFLETDMAGLDALAQKGNATGAVSLSDGRLTVEAIRAYLADGMSEADLAAEAFHAMAHNLVRVIGEKRISGKVAFVGLSFDQMPALREAFASVLELTPENVLALPDAALSAASGAARLSVSQGYVTLEALIERMAAFAETEQLSSYMRFEPVELRVQRASILSLPDRQRIPKKVGKWRERLITVLPLG